MIYLVIQSNIEKSARKVTTYEKRAKTNLNSFFKFTPPIFIITYILILAMQFTKNGQKNKEKKCRLKIIYENSV